MNILIMLQNSKLKYQLHQFFYFANLEKAVKIIYMKMRGKQFLTWLLIIVFSFTPLIFAHYHPIPEHFKFLSSQEESDGFSNDIPCPICELETALLTLCFLVSFILCLSLSSFSYVILTPLFHERESKRNYSIRAPPF